MLPLTSGKDAVVMPMPKVLKRILEFAIGIYVGLMVCLWIAAMWYVISVYRQPEPAPFVLGTDLGVNNLIYEIDNANEQPVAPE